MEGLIFGILRYFTDRAKMCKEIHFNPLSPNDDQFSLINNHNKTISTRKGCKN